MCGFISVLAAFKFRKSVKEEGSLSVGWTGAVNHQIWTFTFTLHLRNGGHIDTHPITLLLKHNDGLNNDSFSASLHDKMAVARKISTFKDFTTVCRIVHL